MSIEPGGLERTTDAGLPSAEPPETFVEVHRWELTTLEELARLRGELLGRITAVGTEPRDLDDVPRNMVLVASELATNALRHGRPPTVVRLLSDGSGFALDVADHDVVSIPVLAGERRPGAGGFGLLIARRLAQDVGWYTRTETKHVWAAFAAPS
ncbi:ATP-binding protein [Cellulomonas endophytica]|uniref:ATP-binding protein n=1 Tax=Cellulomonas endophytica TaxID=2494735 RepID=UPI00196A54FC|nr:ATP-binding protein [Cellulomonas endophytica]